MHELTLNYTFNLNIKARFNYISLLTFVAFNLLLHLLSLQFHLTLFYNIKLIFYFHQNKTSFIANKKKKILIKYKFYDSCVDHLIFDSLNLILYNTIFIKEYLTTRI